MHTDGVSGKNKSDKVMVEIRIKEGVRVKLVKVYDISFVFVILTDR